MAVTLKEVAELAGVSRSAVSRAFTQGASVSEKTRKRVEDAAAKLGYQPNALASSLTTGRTKMIGLVSDNFHNPFFLQVFDLFTRGLQDRGLRPLLLNLSDAEDPAQSVRLLRQYSVDGVVVASSTLPPAYALEFRKAHIPVVQSFGRIKDEPDVHQVTIDNHACGRMAAETLLARGYRKIGFMGGPYSATSTQDRWAGFKVALEGEGGVTISYSFAEAYTFEAGRAEMLRLLQGDDRAEAYFCGDDVTAIGALSAVQSLGLRCPEDVGLIGLNDMEMAGWENISLTTIHQPIDQMVEASLKLMDDLLDHPQLAPRATVKGCHIVERATLRALP